MAKIKITADGITGVLQQKHHNDIFIPECKTGPSQGASSHSRFDVLVITKSWAYPAVIGYEIKVSRQDFLHDIKWVNYLEFCNELYFVCPPKLISVDEVPEDVGLYWTSKSGTMLYQKKKAKHRLIDIPDSLWRYILMWRARIGPENTLNGKDFWVNWLKNRKIDRDFGWRVGRTIKETIKNEIDKVKTENQRLNNLIHRYKDIKTMIAKMGYTAESFSEFDVRRRIVAGTIDTTRASRSIRAIMEDIQYLESFVHDLEDQKPKS